MTDPASLSVCCSVALLVLSWVAMVGAMPILASLLAAMAFGCAVYAFWL